MKVLVEHSLTRGAIWIALTLYVLSEWRRLASERDGRWGHFARWAWTLSCIAYLGHVAAAFHFFHGWSHAAAYSATARQTKALFGFNWGGGIYFNYFLTAIWLGETIWWWIAPAHFRERPRWVTLMARAIFVFMILNGTVVFAAGKVRWFGCVITLCAGYLWLREYRLFKGSLQKVLHS